MEFLNEQIYKRPNRPFKLEKKLPDNLKIIYHMHKIINKNITFNI